MSNTPEMNDHDLLIMIHTQLQRALQDIADIKTSQDKGLSKEDADKLTVESDKIHIDHEKRLRWCETYLRYGIAFALLIELVVHGAAWFKH